MSLIDLVFPKDCLECRKYGKYVCDECISKVENPKPICPVCKRSSIDGFTHTKCQRSLGMDGLISIWNYDKVIKKAITSLKYKYATEIVTELMNHIEIKLKNSEVLISNEYCLTPVPLHWHRENSRGFNQSDLFGKEIAKKMNWKYIPDLVIRKKMVSPQVGLEGKDRINNVKDIFSLNLHYSLPAIHQTIIIFDDVYTTGSTLKEITKVLKRSGAQKVWGLTIAR
jgi:ComF family protein